MLKWIILLSGFSHCLWGQALSWGLRAGTPLNDAFEVARSGTIGFQSIPKHFTIGPTLEVHLPFKLAVSIDALYRKLEYQSTNGSSTANQSASQWEFPLLLKYRFGDGNIRPFLAAGPTFNRITGLAVDNPVEFVKKSAAGIVFAGGIELKVPIIRITPELRFTHWGSENFSHPVNALLKSNLNQAVFLVGITF
ncbi:MAG: PorT family protein [Acidobacteriia bacterium]|nr:PorT family protein [Terriglobia bacterium]